MKSKKRLIMLFCVIMVIFIIGCGIGWYYYSKQKHEVDNLEQLQPTVVEQNQNSQNESPALDSIDSDNVMKIINGILIVNKNYGLPIDYNPGNNREAVDQLQRLQQLARNNGFDVSYDFSGFRSYEYQTTLYNNYVQKDGQAAADRYSARPGFSEHQTGLAFDLKSNNGQLLTDPAAAEFIKQHCADYGFIVRYPDGKEAITGYQYEPWHLRYVGVGPAQSIMQQNTTLDQYLGVK